VFRPFFWHQTPTETNISVKSDFQLKSAHANTSQTFYSICPPARENRPKPGGFPRGFLWLQSTLERGKWPKSPNRPGATKKKTKKRQKKDKKKRQKKRQKRHYPTPGGFQSPCPRRSRGLHRGAENHFYAKKNKGVFSLLLSLSACLPGLSHTQRFANDRLAVLREKSEGSVERKWEWRVKW